MKKIDKTISVIDVGSNSVRLMAVKGGEKLKFLITTRLAEGKVGNRLANISIERTVNAVAVLFDKAIKLGSDKIYVFATAAVRSSENGCEVATLIKDKTGLVVDVISGEQEAELALLGALQGNDGGVIDIGGASTEVAVSLSGERSHKKSYSIGAVSYKELEDKTCLSSIFSNVNDEFDCKFFGVGGTITTLCAIDLGLTEYCPEKLNGHYLSKERVEELKRLLCSLTPEEIKEKFPIATKRADVIGGGANILLSVMSAYNINGIYGSDSDNLEGYLESVKRYEETQN
ncbi:MAG: hypothetical protein E7358_06330 [Clostridiales bacterium]|nr:hypothetical protein [Clostridiales bacterium]